MECIGGATDPPVVVNRDIVRPQLVHILGLEAARLHFDDRVAVQLRMVEQQVEPLLGLPHLEAVLTAQKGEPCSQLHEELRDVCHQGVLEFLLVIALAAIPYGNLLRIIPFRWKQLIKPLHVP